MALFQFSNFAKATLSGTHTSSATTFNLVSGQGNRFPVAPFYLVVWNSTDFTDSADAFWAGAAEIVIVGSNPTADTLPGLTRGADGTTALNLNVAGKTYQCFIPENAGWLNNSINIDDTSGEAIVSAGLDVTGDSTFDKKVILPPVSGTLTITANAITITGSNHVINNTAVDTISTINGGSTGQLLLLRINTTGANIITIAEGGNLQIDAAGAFAMNSAGDTILLYAASTAAWRELSRSNNA